ncbi:DUF2063 domain-containing protein [Aestuariibius sp. 2305UL40-4]|uniref:HvfC/BufC N-terminal domain-containing protein n=1 Tax=Aestuariibius violaceus TaxID=3234132 RepID=UPI00345E8D12
MTDFVSALLDPQQTPPADLIDPTGCRFNVYRNNVAVSLTEALEAAFPVTKALVGDEFFKAMAGVFLRQHPPASPRLALYGDTLPAFLETFEPAKSLPYLPDVARLEQGLRESYHAADHTPLDANALAGMAEGTLLKTRLVFAPSTCLITSDWPIASLWRSHTEGLPMPKMAPETVLITRPEWDPVPHAVPQHNAATLQNLMTGASLGEALTPEADFAALLSLLLTQNALQDPERPTT